MPATPEHHPAAKLKPKKQVERRPPSSDSEEAPFCNRIDMLAARLSRTERGELVAALPDDVLARLIIAVARQLRRRLAHSRGRGGKGRASALERSAQQLVIELSGLEENDDDWYAG